MSHRLMLLEDNVSIARLYTKILHQAEYEVEHAATIDEADVLLHSHTYDGVLFDVEIGAGSSLELLRACYDELIAKRTAVIVISGHEQYRIQCQQMGVEFFLLKPIDKEALTRMVDSLVRGTAASATRWRRRSG